MTFFISINEDLFRSYLTFRHTFRSVGSIFSFATFSSPNAKRLVEGKTVVPFRVRKCRIRDVAFVWYLSQAKPAKKQRRECSYRDTFLKKETLQAYEKRLKFVMTGVKCVVARGGRNAEKNRDRAVSNRRRNRT